jgi:hypothetical protein
VRPARFERATSGSVDRRSIQLSYGRAERRTHSTPVAHVNKVAGVGSMFFAFVLGRHRRSRTGPGASPDSDDSSAPIVPSVGPRSCGCANALPRPDNAPSAREEPAGRQPRETQARPRSSKTAGRCGLWTRDARWAAEQRSAG